MDYVEASLALGLLYFWDIKAALIFVIVVLMNRYYKQNN